MLERKEIILKIEDLSKQLAMYYGEIVVVKVNVNMKTSNAEMNIEIKKL